MNTFEFAFQKNLIPWREDCSSLRKNARLGNSLIDYLFACKGNPVYMEVKSAVLREGNYAMFPDCPSLRGQRHVKDLIDWAQKGGDAFVLFMAALYDLLKGAKNSGVVVKTMGLYFNPADSFLYVYNPDFEVVFS